MSEILPDAPARIGLTARFRVHTALIAARLVRGLPPVRLRRLLGRTSVGARPATYAEAKRARDQILTASAYSRGGDACLLRSIAVAFVCRQRGVWPTWAVGVLAVPPFAAHAWVEAEGRIVDEPMDQRDYRAFFKVPPRLRSPIRSTDRRSTPREEVQS